MTERTNRDGDNEERIDRLIALALREPADDALPPAFAAMVAARTEAAAQAAVEWKERLIQGAFVACLALTALAGFGPDIVALLGRSDVGTRGGPSAAVQWSLAIGACLAVTLLVEMWTRGRHAPRHGVEPWSA
jgi:hypothetical protein